jgi:hypothetical protein
MRALHLLSAVALLVVPVARPAAAQQAPASGAALACQPQAPVPGRASPYDSTVVPLGAAHALICYSRPSLRGRQMLGGAAVPWGKLWRTGANEPTTIHLPVAATIAGLRVEPGSYSLYTIPGEKEWTVIVNRSTSQWGIESQYTAAIEKQEVGRAQVPAEAVQKAIETFTIQAVPAGDHGANVILEWEHSRVSIPVVAVPG